MLYALKLYFVSVNSTTGVDIMIETKGSSRQVLSVNRCPQEKAQYDTSHKYSLSLQLFSA